MTAANLNILISRPSDILQGAELETYYSPFSKEQIALADRNREIEHRYEMTFAEMFSEED